MQIRPLTPDDLRFLADIDATIESTQYLHLEKTGEAMTLGLRVELRPLREKQITPNPLDDELALAFRQIATGADEGIGLVAEHDGQIVAAAVAIVNPAHGTLQLLDMRVDCDFRRQGLGTALIYQIIAKGRETEGIRAVSAETRTNNFPANQFLLKSGFDLSGVDLRRHSNHDMVKESATLFWYAQIEGAFPPAKG
jgi:RimJ/RimL family protein N-acetyltransferase